MNTLLKTIGENLQKHDKIQFTGFGSFIAENKTEREARNPKNGEIIKVPAKRSVKFKVGDVLKGVVNS